MLALFNVWRYPRFITFILVVIGFCATPGCDKAALQVTYHSPWIIPLQITVNSWGEIEIGASELIVTPLGAFEIGIITDPRKYFDGVQNILSIQIDDQECLYDLSDKNFQVDLNSENFQLDLEAHDYKLVGLRKEGGSIFIELEGNGYTGCKQRPVRAAKIGNAAEGCPGASPSHLAVGDTAYVSVMQAAVHQTPSELAPLVKNKYLRENRIVTIIDGPVCGPGNPGHVLFWKVRSEEIRFSDGTRGMLVGWIGEESGDIYLLRPR